MTQYILIIDAGSSGTRMNAYTWHNPSHQSTTMLPTLTPISPDAAPDKIPIRSAETRRAYKRVETEPGLEKFTASLHTIKTTALSPLLDWAKAVVPSSQWASTPIFLFGTAGMRRMVDGDRKRVLQEVRAVLHTSGFLFENDWAKVVSGTDEGVYGWIALNSAAGRLGTKRTLGTLDLGGSSLEVTFDVGGGDGTPCDKNSARPVDVSFLGVTHSLYSYSHRHFGLDDAFERSVSILIHQKANSINSNLTSSFSSAAATNTTTSEKSIVLDNKTVIEHPCLHQGYTEQYTRIPLFDIAPSPLKIILRGKPEYQACARLVASVIDLPLPREGTGAEAVGAVTDGGVATHCARKKEEDSSSITAATLSSSCALGVPQPSTSNKHFVALAGFYVVMHFFDIGIQQSVSDVHVAGETFCSLHWEDVLSKHRGELSAENYCFRAPYVVELIERGLGIDVGRVKLGAPETSWTLGAALLEGHRVAGLAKSSAQGFISHSDSHSHSDSIKEGLFLSTGEMVVAFVLLASISIVLIGVVALTCTSSSSSSLSSSSYTNNTIMKLRHRFSGFHGSSSPFLNSTLRQSFGSDIRIAMPSGSPSSINIAHGGDDNDAHLSKNSTAGNNNTLIGNGKERGESTSGGSAGSWYGNDDGEVAYRSNNGMSRSQTYSRRLSQLESGSIAGVDA